MDVFKIIFLLFLCSSTSTSKKNVDSFHDELFGSGDFYEGYKIMNGSKKHLSSSVEDLMILFDAEKQFVKSLKTSQWKNAIKSEFLKVVDYDEKVQDVEYVFHPFNAFHLLSRVVKYVPKIQELNDKIQFNSSFVLEDTTVQEAAIGLANLQEFINANITDLVLGKMRNYEEGKEFISKSPLTTNEALIVANAAKESGYLESHVQWCQVALQLAKKSKSKKSISKIKQLVQIAQKSHDFFFHLVDHGEPAHGLSERPYKPSKDTEEIQEFHDKMREQAISNYDNLLPNNTYEFDHGVLNYQLSLYLRRRIQGLCRGDFERPAHLEKDLKCIYVNHEDPYLKLGPFQLEILHRNPQIGIFRQLVSKTEFEPIKTLARGQMVSTPYDTGKGFKMYSKRRTSKIKYFNEELAPEAQTLSKKIALATRFLMKKEIFASENFQIMNYGIGGRISLHVDSKGGKTKTHSSEKDVYGGERFTTFMIYLSNVEAGGHTIFPQAGIHVKPVEGDALYWFNLGSHYTYDSRILHLGCPVIHGNKWIANKWVKILPQFRNYPCSVDNPFFSIVNKPI